MHLSLLSIKIYGNEILLETMYIIKFFKHCIYPNFNHSRNHDKLEKHNAQILNHPKLIVYLTEK